VRAGDIRRALAERRRALKKEMAEARDEAEARLGEVPAVRRERRRRRVKRILGLILLAVLASFLRCECGEPSTAPPKSPRELVVDGGARKAPPGPQLRAPVGGRLGRQPRAAFPEASPVALSWLEDFRIQVAARSPRLARCFTGASQPGTLRWSAALHPSSGAVSDQKLEAVDSESSLGEAQRVCVEAALSSPAYRLVAPSGEADSLRVSLVIEF
jgi:hypothetical protein